MTGEQAHELAMAVKVLCDVRLACTLLLAIAVPVMGLSWEVTLLVLVSLALSYLLLRHWDPLGARLMEGWWLPAVESLVAMLLFVQFGSSGLGAAYLGASLALLACAGGWRAMAVSLGAFLAIIVLALAGLFPTLGGGRVGESIWLLSLVVLMGVCSGGGYYLRSMLFSRVELVEQRRAAERLEASSQERLRLAHELHDGVSKTLHGCYMIADSLSRQLAGEGHVQADKARQLTHSLEVARQESRDLMYELRQVPATDLVPYCRRVVSQWARENPGVRVAEDFAGDQLVVPVRTRHEVLRVLGELLENVRRHSRSPELAVTLAREDGEGVLVVADRGVGLPRDVPLEALQRDGHFGLAGVRERMELVRGAFRIESDAGGARAEARFPVLAAQERSAG